VLSAILFVGDQQRRFPGRKAHKIAVGTSNNRPEAVSILNGLFLAINSSSERSVHLIQMLHPDYPRQRAAVKTGVGKCRSQRQWLQQTAPMLGVGRFLIPGRIEALSSLPRFYSKNKKAFGFPCRGSRVGCIIHKFAGGTSAITANKNGLCESKVDRALLARGYNCPRRRVDFKTARRSGPIHQEQARMTADLDRVPNFRGGTRRATCERCFKAFLSSVATARSEISQVIRPAVVLMC
jgi:hypothetical protein